MKTVEINKTEVIVNAKAKSSIWYIILAWFFGILGIHNFYAGYYIKGLVQLILTLISWQFMFIPLFVVMIWVFLEVLFVNKDAQGIPFVGGGIWAFLLRLLAALSLLGSLYYIYVGNFLVYEVSETTPANQEVSVEVTE